MRAISYIHKGLPIEDPASLQDIFMPKPSPGTRELLVEVKAVSVNPVDTKVRAGTFTGEPKILGWDAAGIVREVGAQVTLFKPGDQSRQPHQCRQHAPCPCAGREWQGARQDRPGGLLKRV